MINLTTLVIGWLVFIKNLHWEMAGCQITPFDNRPGFSRLLGLFAAFRASLSFGCRLLRLPAGPPFGCRRSMRCLICERVSTVGETQLRTRFALIKVSCEHVRFGLAQAQTE